MILCQITSQAVGDRYGIPLEVDDFINGNLRHPSNIRPNRLFTADSNIILYRAGTISSAKMQEVVDRIVNILQT